MALLSLKGNFLEESDTFFVAFERIKRKFTFAHENYDLLGRINKKDQVILNGPDRMI